MDLILGLIAFAIALFMLLPTAKIIKKINKSLYLKIEKFQKDYMIFSQKLLVASLIGLIVFTIFTSSIDSILQRIAVILVAAVLIFAVNIKLPAPDNRD